jgi:sterol desaturase/sphingolipid hydroxylase (fatty acid hydroxylase superfamily)
MIAAVSLGGAVVALGGPRRLGIVGLCATFLAMLLGGPYVAVGEVGSGHVYLGLDWLVLDLFFTGIAFVALEALFPRVNPDQPILRSGWRLDLAYFGVNHLAIGMFLVTSAHVAHDGFGWAVSPWLQAHVTALPAFLRFVLVVLAADLVEYLSHRAYHEVPALWRIHAVHHSPQQMDWLAGSRLHVLEPLVTRAVILVPIFLLGFPQDTIYAYLIWVTVQSVLIHSNIAMEAGWFGYVVVTPQFHHWHHASDEEALDKNYSAHTPLFDLIFGTWHMPKGRWPRQYGTVKPIPGGMVKQFLYPFTAPVVAFLEKRSQ